MSDGICPFATLLQGASWGENASRRLSVTAVTIHTTEGRNSVGLGQGRTHSSPGTFNFLTGARGELWQFYPSDVRCSHAAGGNNVGPGIENEGFTGQPFPDAQLAILGRLCHWLSDTYGVPLVYKSGDPRIYLDQSGYRGFIAHRAIDYPPNRSYNHYDSITDDEWQRAIGGAPAPSPTPEPTRGRRSMIFVLDDYKNKEAYQFIGSNPQDKNHYIRLYGVEGMVNGSRGASSVSLRKDEFEDYVAGRDLNNNPASARGWTF